MSKERLCDTCGDVIPSRGIKNAKTTVPLRYKIYKALGGGAYGWATKDLCKECRTNLEVLLRVLHGTDCTVADLRGMIEQETNADE